jgi:hypothetical protein
VHPVSDVEAVWFAREYARHITRSGSTISFTGAVIDSGESGGTTIYKVYEDASDSFYTLGYTSGENIRVLHWTFSGTEMVYDATHGLKQVTFSGTINPDTAMNFVDEETLIGRVAANIEVRDIATSNLIAELTEAEIEEAIGYPIGSTLSRLASIGNNLYIFAASGPTALSQISIVIEYDPVEEEFTVLRVLGGIPELDNKSTSILTPGSIVSVVEDDEGEDHEFGATGGFSRSITDIDEKGLLYYLTSPTQRLQRTTHSFVIEGAGDNDGTYAQVSQSGNTSLDRLFINDIPAELGDFSNVTVSWDPAASQGRVWKKKGDNYFLATDSD